MPRIKTTRTVRIALWALRIYLIVLLSLIGLKFLRISTSDVKKTVQVPAEKTLPRP